MRTSTPAWTLPLSLALLGIVLLIGNLGALPMALAITGTAVYVVYSVARSRWGTDDVQPISHLMALFPGHLLLLLAISTLDVPDTLACLWAIIPAATVGYDWTARRRMGSVRRRVSILLGLYAILWADVIVLLERTIAMKRGFTRGEEVLIAVAFGLAGSLFIGLGIYRHWLTAKE
ncbi:hypothetical protein KJ567_01765 [Candidatus Bipolaricaulota bacterium]|nr:hypothetical protein [Candidatus Bipolaricaulota bacterium]